MRKTTCETVAAIALHIREVPHGENNNYSGNTTGAKTLCGAKVGWDTKYDLNHATCSDCRELSGQKPQ